MKLLYLTSDRSFAELAFLTLQREGIQTYSSDSDAATGFGFMLMQRQYRIYILRDEDFDFAKQLLREIGADFPTSVQLPAGKHTKWLMFFIGLLLALMIALAGKT